MFCLTFHITTVNCKSVQQCGDLSGYRHDTLISCNRKREVTMDKILRINMGSEGGPQASEEPLGDYAGLGGRGMTSAIVAKEVPPLCTRWVRTISW